MLSNIITLLASTLALRAAPTIAMTIPSAAAADYTMGFIGCSMSENVAQGYVADGGKRMWGPYGTGALVVQSVSEKKKKV